MGQAARWFHPPSSWPLSPSATSLRPFPNASFLPDRPPWRGPVVEGALGLHRGAFRSAADCKMRAERHPSARSAAGESVAAPWIRFAPEENPVHSAPSDARRQAYYATVNAYRLAFLPLWKLFDAAHHAGSSIACCAARREPPSSTRARDRLVAGIAARAFPRHRGRRRFLSALPRGRAPRARSPEPALRRGGFWQRFRIATVATKRGLQPRLDTIPAREAALRELRRSSVPAGELLLFLKGSATWPDRLLETGLGAILGRAPGKLWHEEPLHRSLGVLAKRHGFVIADLHQTALMTRAALRAVAT